MGKNNKRFSKVLMILFLTLIVLGFTIPGFVNNNTGTTIEKQAEPRLCRSDADCYLSCDGKPLPVLCAQNLCQQNKCGYSYYSFDPERKFTFKLVVNVAKLGDQPLNLVDRADSHNLFVKFLADNVVEVYSGQLSLNQVLDKANLALQGSCLRVNSESYCNNDGNLLSVLVNEEVVASTETYLPQPDDVIKISYSNAINS